MSSISFFDSMSIENVLAIFVPLIAVPVIALIGFFLKGLLKTIKDDLENQGINIKKLSDRFSDFQLSIQKVGSTLTAVEKDLDRANINLNKTNSLAEGNSDKIRDIQHTLLNTQANLQLANENIKDHIEKIDSLEKKVFVLNQKLK
jgi:methyl-accepting chemotaxis protein